MAAVAEAKTGKGICRFMIEAAIADYIDHLGDPGYFATVISSTGEQGLIDALARIIRSDDDERVNQACLFIRDLILIAPKHGVGLAFRDRYYASPIIDELERALIADNHFIRKHAIYTLGKTGSTRSITEMYRAFDLLSERDPVILPRLVGEIWWLEQDKKNWSMIDRMTGGTHYTTRWASLQAIAPYSRFEGLQEVMLRCIECLRADDEPLVRAEAEYRYREIALAGVSPELSKAEYKRRRRELDRSRPEVCFQDIELWFVHFLIAHHMVSYSLGDLEQFMATELSICVQNRRNYQSTAKKS